MATTIIAASGKVPRATQHPLFIDLVQMEFDARLRRTEASQALREAINAAVNGLAEADPEDLLLSDEQWEEKSLLAMGH